MEKKDEEKNGRKRKRKRRRLKNRKKMETEEKILKGKEKKMKTRPDTPQLRVDGQGQEKIMKRVSRGFRKDQWDS